MTGPDSSRDAIATAESAAERDPELAQRIGALAGQGCKRAHILQQLLGQYPPERLRPFFADFAAGAFVPTGDSVTQPSIAAQLDLVLERARRGGATSSMPRVPPTSVPREVASQREPTASTRVSTPAQNLSTELDEPIAFQYVPLIQCSFPHTEPKGQSTFTRRNGWLTLTLASHEPSLGLPYGVPARLLTMYLASQAMRTRSPEIFLGASVHDFLRLLDVPITRGARGSIAVYSDQILRLTHCSISAHEELRDTAGREGLHIRQALFAEEARLWWDAGRAVGQGSSIVLSPTLYESILERSAPLSTRAIKQLRKSPMDLDVYAWLVHRLHHLGRPSNVSWAQLSGQFGHNYRELRMFRRYFLDSLKRVLAAYPEAQVRPNDSGLLLLPSAPHVAHRRD